MRSIRLPRTSTFDGADRDLPVPSKMRTFWNSVAPATVVCAAAALPIEHSHADTAIDLMNARIMGLDSPDRLLQFLSTLMPGILLAERHACHQRRGLAEQLIEAGRDQAVASCQRLRH